MSGNILNMEIERDVQNCFPDIPDDEIFRIVTHLQTQGESCLKPLENLNKQNFIRSDCVADVQADQSLNSFTKVIKDDEQRKIQIKCDGKPILDLEPQYLELLYLQANKYWELVEQKEKGFTLVIQILNDSCVKTQGIYEETFDFWIIFAITFCGTFGGLSAGALGLMYGILIGLMLALVKYMYIIKTRKSRLDTKRQEVENFKEKESLIDI